MWLIKRVYGYLAKIKHAIIRIRIVQLDFSGLPTVGFDWGGIFLWKYIGKLIPTDTHEYLVAMSL